MAALDPAVAAVRTSVRTALTGLPENALVLVACSGGADSMALAGATAFVAPRLGLRAGLVTVDHRLQDGSADRAATVAAWARDAGFAPAMSVPVDATPDAQGPEAAARRARYAALAGVARAESARAVLTGHTRDDQAETVLLALARGGGPRGLAGMRARRDLEGGTLLRPLLSVSRSQTRAACAAEGVAVWDDPHNTEDRFARVRVREAMDTLIAALGADVVPNLARTAELVAADTDALDAMAVSARDGVEVDGRLECARLAELPSALRTRVLRAFALDAGAPGGALAAIHIAALDALVVRWRGQGPAALPGGHRVARIDGWLELLV